jgi:hypothetical protein
VPDDTEALNEAVGPDRRTFVKRLVATTAFAAPVVSSFTMSGIEAVFGTKVGATTLMGNTNSAGPKYPTMVATGNTSTLNGLGLFGSSGPTSMTLGVPKGAIPANTVVNVFTGSPSNFTALLPAGYTPKSAFAVAWTGPNASHPVGLVVSDPAVGPGDQIFLISNNTATSFPGALGTGIWAVLFTQDPSFVVATPPPAPTPSSGGTTAAAPVTVTPRFTG